MIISEDRNKIYCHKCKDWKLIFGYPSKVMMPNNDVLCLDCLTHLGFYWDLFPGTECNIFDFNDFYYNNYRNENGTMG